MPTYEYVCVCGLKFEHFLQMTEEHKKVCLSCGKVVKPKIGTGAAIIFKGSGFYANDYKKQMTKGDREEVRREKQEAKVVKDESD